MLSLIVLSIVVLVNSSIKIGILFPFYDELWGSYGSNFSSYNSSSTAIDIQYCNQSISLQQAYAEKYIASKIDVLILTAQDSKAPKNIVTYSKMLGVKVISFIRPIYNTKVDAYVAPDNYQAGVLMAQFINQKASTAEETKEILILRGPDNDLNSKTFYEGITKTLDFSLFQDTHTQMIDNWDPEEAREYAMSLSDEVKNKIGYVIAANDDIGLEFHRGFNRTGYVMASHDNQKEKVKELCREFPNDTFMTVDFDQETSVRLTMEVARNLTENLPIDFTNLIDINNNNQPVITHPVHPVYCNTLS